MPAQKNQKGWYIAADAPPKVGSAAILYALQELHRDLAVVRHGQDLAVGSATGIIYSDSQPSPQAVPLMACVPALTPENLGDPTFQQVYGVRANYVAGAMANGISSEAIVIAMAKTGLMGFFGAAGLPTARIRQAIQTIQTEVGHLPYGFNLIHSPQDLAQEQETVDLYLETGVHTVSASAFMKLTPMVVQYRVTGLTRDAAGRVHAPNRILAKISRQEVAELFMRPAPTRILEQLVAANKITATEAQLAREIPMAEDITAEADSGGHTDNQPAPVLIPLMCALRNRIAAEEGYDRPIRIGAAGGISTPQSVAAAFTMGAAYVLTGSINQSCIEAGTSPMVKQMLATAATSDVGMAHAGDMFEQGVEVQVLKRGSLFAMRSKKLYSLYRQYDRLEDIPADELEKLERQVFQRSVADIWRECHQFFSERDPAQLDRANKEPRHKMALVFRWYLGLSSRWAIAGQQDRKTDVQIWCGPGIGAFNAWTHGTFLAEPQNRRVAVVAANLMAGAAALIRSQTLLQQGVDPGTAATVWIPRPLS